MPEPEQVCEIIQKPVLPAKKALPAVLEQYKFKPGQTHVRSPGRPKGSKNAATIYMESLPIKAQQWVKSQAPAVLIDARKIGLPLESDRAFRHDSTLLAFFERKLIDRSPPPLVDHDVTHEG